MTTCFKIIEIGEIAPYPQYVITERTPRERSFKFSAGQRKFVLVKGVVETLTLIKAPVGFLPFRTVQRERTLMNADDLKA